MNAENFKKAIYEGKSTGNWNLLEEWILEESSFTYNYKPLPEEPAFDEEAYNQIVDLLNNVDFLMSSGSSHILRLLEYDWGILSEDQKKPTLTDSQSSISKNQTWYDMVSNI